MKLNSNTTIIPALDLIDGKVVRLYQGDYQLQNNYANDPSWIIDKYIKQGATYLHIVDLSGAKDPNYRQINLLSKLATNYKIKLQIGGGIRNTDDIKQLFDLGAAKVVIGTNAIINPQMVIEWINQFGNDKIVLSLDIRINSKGKNLIATNAWQNLSDITLEQQIDFYLKHNLKHVLCTDISKDGTLQGCNVELYTNLKLSYPTINWQVSGGVSNLNEIKLLKELNISAIIIGKALLENKFNLKDAIIC